LASLVEGLLDRARDADLDIDYRVATVESLGQIAIQTCHTAITEALLALARGENGDERVPFSVQIAAARGLERVLAAKGDAQIAEQMWDLARDSEVDDSVRRVLVEMLAHLGGAEQAAQVLIELVQDDKVYPPGHRDALDALGRVGYADQGILDIVLKIAGTKDRKVKDFERLAASHALAGLGHLDLSLQHLLMLIADKSIYRSTRNDALGYLGQLGSTGDADLDAAAVAVLQIWVNEENTTEDVRENAMQSLRWLKASQDEVVRDLIGVVQNRTTFPRVRRAAVGTLSYLGGGQKEMVTEALSPSFYDPEEKSDMLRVPVARLLFLWGGDEQALAYLRAAAEQSYMAQVRYNASMVLLEVGETELATAELIKLAQNPDISDVIRYDALRALGLWKVGDEEVAEAVATVAQDASLESNVRGSAYASLSSVTSA
jgi:type III secretion system FlhB-like substrate exporter